jgi:UDP-N-acetylmuramoyl-L-alanyl-D-glutamate--2,6-diaminopimelate ligase
LHDLLEGLDVLELRGALDVDVRSVVHDSRDAGPGALFACIRGAVTDGHAHAAAAVDAGAVALLVESWVPPAVAQVQVRSVREVLGPIAAQFHAHPSRAMRVLGITGTNGKTTTTYLLESIGGAHGETAGVIGTVGARIAGRPVPLARTTPEATDLQSLFAIMRDAGVTTVAMEVSSHALDQHRVDGTEFTAVCFTNLSHDHLDYHPTMDRYFEAKAALFDRRFAPRAAVNLDDGHGESLRARAQAAGLDVWTFGLGDTDMTAADVVMHGRGTTFRLISTRDGADAPIEFGLVGPYNVLNALAAAATARAADISFHAIVSGLQAPVVVPGRFERVDAGQPFAVLVDYAHTPEALERVLVAARALTGDRGRVLVVYGCGGDRDRAKRPLMGAAAATFADAAYLTSDNPRSEDPAAIAAEVLAGVPAANQPIVDLDRRAAIRQAVTDARPVDVVVVAGKGHETGQTANGVTTPFDDRVVAREELEALACR